MNILFIDDEKRIEPIVEYLKAFDHDVYVAQTVHDGYNYFRENKDKIDVVILDVMMPVTEEAKRMNLIDIKKADLGYSTGLVLYEKLKELIPPDHHLTIVILSARMDIKNFALLKEDLQSEKVIVLEKPVRSSVLLEEITKAHKPHQSK
ncbi:hypothetical protein [Spirosoma gilvum]